MAHRSARTGRYVTSHGSPFAEVWSCQCPALLSKNVRSRRWARDVLNVQMPLVRDPNSEPLFGHGDQRPDSIDDIKRKSPHGFGRQLVKEQRGRSGQGAVSISLTE